MASRVALPAATAAAVAVVGVVAGFALWRNVDEPIHSPASCVLAAAPRGGTAGVSSVAPDSGGVRVVEKAFTQVGPKTVSVSLGAVLENSSAMAAYRVRVSFRVLDERGRSVVPAKSGELLQQEIPVILPGQRIGAGAWTYVRENPAGRPVTVTRFEIALGEARWLPHNKRQPRLAPITTHHERIARSPVEPQSGTVRYSVESDYCQPATPRGVAVLFRDNHGRLVGGSFDLDNSQPRCRPGRHTESVIAFRSIPDGIDAGKTNSYPYCDPAPAAGTLSP